MAVTEITDKNEAIEAVKAAAFVDENGHPLLHSFPWRGPLIGCDWSLKSVLEEIEHADQLAWDDEGFAGHELVTNRNGRAMSFDVSKP